MYLYAIAIAATKKEAVGSLITTTNSVASGHVVAGSADEARGKAFRLSEEEFPKEEGWYGHHTGIALIPADLMRGVLAQE